MPPAPDAAQTLHRLLHERYSCRGFRAEPVPRETLDEILRLAQRTASWCNSQPWRVHLCSPALTERLRAEFVAHAQAHDWAPELPFPSAYRGVYLERRRDCGLRLYRAVGVERGDAAAAERQRLENFRFFGAPQVLLLTTDAALGVYGAVDCGAWVNGFMLAARAFGVASIAQAALACYPAFWRQRLEIGADRHIVCGISFGYEDPAHPANAFRTGRAALDEVVHWEDVD
ncbi:MAG: nitroreductase [Rubrivivax sp.]